MDLLFGFSGRIGRGQWWLGQLVISLLFIVGAVAIYNGGVAAGGLGILLLIGVMIIGCVWINLAVCVKRFHDRAKSGYWFFINFVPIIGPVWLLVECGFLAGSPGSNSYGPPSGSGGNHDDLVAEVASAHANPELARRVTPAARPAPAAPRRTAPASRHPAQLGFGRRGLT